MGEAALPCHLVESSLNAFQELHGLNPEDCAQSLKCLGVETDENLLLSFVFRFASNVPCSSGNDHVYRR